ncbi:MAG: peptide chain release factor N(5)-glutamine methyltransferase [Lachnospiraceae bacterium]|nr:peptide chain release factor N(5)-glutamine methyltransferase [Lachnospiraceae bacterium]
MTLRDLIVYGQNLLKDSGIEDYESDTRILAMFAFGINYTDMFMKMSEDMPDDSIDFYKNCLDLRCEHVPCQYITGSQEFMGYEFITEEGVLIPRQETEILVEKALELTSGIKECKALDMCTGSGCIGISYELKRREAGFNNDTIHLADISDDALAVADKNKYKLNSKCKIIKTDLFEKIVDRYDIIMSNPPYIKTSDIDEIMEEVREYEPRLALDGDSDGLSYYRKIAAKAVKYLYKNGILFLEIGYEQYEDVRDMLLTYGFSDVSVIKDYSGLDRVVVAYATEHDY